MISIKIEDKKPNNTIKLNQLKKGQYAIVIISNHDKILPGQLLLNTYGGVICLNTSGFFYTQDLDVIVEILENKTITIEI